MLTSKTLAISSAKHEQFMATKPSSLTCVNARQSIFAEPTYTCFLSIIQSFVWRIPAPMRAAKFKLLTCALAFLLKNSVSVFGLTCEGAFCAIFSVTLRSLPASNSA